MIMIPFGRHARFTYDANGNTTQIAGSDNSATQYTYDDADRLSSIVYKDDQGVNVSKSTFTYDGLSRLRISRQYIWDTQTNDWSQQNEKRRIYDGKDVVQDRDGNNVVTNSYTRNGNIGGILAMIHYTPNGSGGFTSDKYFYHYDGRGNVTQLTNDGQNIVAKYTYDAFGNTTASGAAAELNQYRFSTKEEIKGLYYYGYRFYSPGLGKWINRDPIGENGGIDIYGFVGNNPVIFADEDGLTIATNTGFLKDWVFGDPPRDRTYTDDDIETKEMQSSVGAQFLRDSFYSNLETLKSKGPCNPPVEVVSNGAYSTPRAYWDTIVNPMTSDLGSTAAQVGGFAGAKAIDNGDCTVTFIIHNVAGAHSFFYHLPFVHDRKSKTGPMSNINQTFIWTEHIDTFDCACSGNFFVGGGGSGSW